MAKTNIEVINPFQTVIDEIMLPYQRADIMSLERFRWSNWSRQTGKSFSKSFRRLMRGIVRRRNQIFLSSSERQSRELMMKVKDHIKALKIGYEVAETQYFEDTQFKQMEIILPEFGIRLIGLPANPQTARGFSGDLFLDEFAMHRNDRDIWAAAFPSLLRNEGELDVASTPKGRSNMFYNMQVNERFEHDTLTILDAIDQGLDTDAVALREALGDDELWRQEFMCEFLDETTAFLTYEMIGACEDQKLPYQLDLEHFQDGKRNVFVGVDIGRKHDLTVLWAFDLVDKKLTSLGLIELSSMPFRQQFEIISGVLACHNVRRCCVDSTGLGMQMAEELAERFGSWKVEPCTFTQSLKSQIAGEMRVKFEDKNIAIPVDAKLRNDLHSIRKNVTAAGNIRLEAPREQGSHADRFWGAALAVHAASEASGPTDFVFDQDFAVSSGSEREAF